jgi:hypothetical protein
MSEEKNKKKNNNQIVTFKTNDQEGGDFLRFFFLKWGCKKGAKKDVTGVYGLSAGSAVF